MDETQVLLPKLKDLRMENKYADGRLLLRPELFYYNQGLTLKHQKVTADKFEKARILFTLSTKMVSEEYMSTLFSEDVIEKLKPQVVSMHGIDLPPELMHWRDSVGIIVKDSVRNSASLTEQMAILRILSEPENELYKNEQGLDQHYLEDEDTESTKRVPMTAQSTINTLERLKRFARNRGSLSRKDLEQLNISTIDTLSINSANSSRRPSRAVSAANTPTAPRASDARKMDFSGLTSSSICMRHSSCSSGRRDSSKFLQRDFTEDCKKDTFSNNELPKFSKHDAIDVAPINFPEKDVTDVDWKGADVESEHEETNEASKQSSPKLSQKNSTKERDTDTTFNSGLLSPPNNCIYNGVREDCSWHSDMVTFAEPRSDISFSDSSYEELLYEILAEYRLEASNESTSSSKNLRKTQMHYNNDILIDKKEFDYRSYRATFRKRFSTPGVLDRCAVESKSLRQGAISLGPDSAVHERATFDTDYEAVRSRFAEHMLIDVSIPVALANTIPISTSYNGSTVYKSFILDRHVDGVIVANAIDGTATLYIQPAHDHCITHTKKTMDKIYSQDSFIKKNYTIECKNSSIKQFSINDSVSNNELSRYSKTVFNSEHEDNSIHHSKASSTVSVASKNTCSGIAAKPNSRVGERLSHITGNNGEVDGSVTDSKAQHENCQLYKDNNNRSALQYGYNISLQNQQKSVDKPTNSQKLTLSMLDPASLNYSHNEPITVHPSLPSLNNTTISTRGAIRSLAKTIQEQMPEKILSHSIVSSNIRATDTGKAVHRHSVLMKSTLPIESRALQENFTNEKINTKICELNTSSLFKKPKAQISNICEPIPTGMMHMGISNSDSSGSTIGAHQQPLNFFEKNALLKYEKFAASKTEQKVLDSWQLTSVYGPNLIPFGGSSIKHSAVYVDIRDIVKAREQIKNRFRTASDTSIIGSISKMEPTKAEASSTLQSTTYIKKDNTISICAPRVSTRDYTDWKLEKYSRRRFNQQ